MNCTRGEFQNLTRFQDDLGGAIGEFFGESQEVSKVNFYCIIYLRFSKMSKFCKENAKTSSAYPESLEIW